MPKSLERLIEMLPLPLLLAAAAIFSLAWLVKELRPHPAYGPVLRDKVFQRGVGLVLGALAAVIIGQMAIEHLRATTFAAGESGLWIAAVQGDSDAAVQRPTAEYLRRDFASDDTPNIVRIALYKDVPASHAAALDLAQRHGALATIWGTVIPGGGATMVVFNVSLRDQKRETRKLCPQYPDIHDFTSAIGAFIKATAPLSPPGGESAQSNYVTNQLRELRADNERMNGVVAQLQRRMNTTPSLRPEVLNPTTLDTPPAIAPKRAKRYGLFIGIDDYSKMNMHYQFAVADAQAMASAFRSSAGQTAQNTITSFLLNGQATRAAVAQAIDRIAQEATPDDQVWLYFSGVGFQHGEEGYLGLSGASIANLTGDSLAASELVGWIKGFRARQVLVMVDPCHSGLVAIHRGVENPDILRALADRKGGKVWLAAGGADELAFEEPRLRHGLFTFSLLDGLSGRADLDSDGFITASELSTYVQSHVASLGEGLGQHPWTETLEGSPDFTIAVANRSESPNR